MQNKISYGEYFGKKKQQHSTYPLDDVNDVAIDAGIRFGCYP